MATERETGRADGRGAIDRERRGQRRPTLVEALPRRRLVTGRRDELASVSLLCGGARMRGSARPRTGAKREESARRQAIRSRRRANAHVRISGAMAFLLRASDCSSKYLSPLRARSREGQRPGGKGRARVTRTPASGHLSEEGSGSDPCGKLDRAKEAPGNNGKKLGCIVTLLGDLWQSLTSNISAPPTPTPHVLQTDAGLSPLTGCWLSLLHFWRPTCSFECA